MAVFDGLQPAQVTPGLMPNLAAFAAEGVTFRNHHPVFPTVTRTGVASIVTGCYPGRHGLAGNTLVARDFDPNRAIEAMETELAEVVEKTGRLLFVPTLGDILSQHGQEYGAVSVGTTGNAYVHNPNAERLGGATIHPEFCLPASLYDEIIGRFGKWPEKDTPNAPRMGHAVQIMTDYILSERSPAVSLIWFSEPDGAQHATGVGSEVSQKALGGADACFGRLLSWLEETGRPGETDILVTSDHGYSTISDTVDIRASVQGAGFLDGADPGGVIAVPIGGSVLFYVHEKDRATVERLAAWLMSQPWCGPLLASQAATGIPGTLPASLAGNEGERAPELAMSFRWDSRANGAGFSGHSYSSSGAPGLGQHGSMSPHELHNVLFARGPSFKSSLSVDTPTGNVDIAPTILRILAIPGADSMDGRVLEEALEGGPAPESVDRFTDVHTAEQEVKGGVYRQQITITHVGATYYVDEGRASLDAQ